MNEVLSFVLIKEKYNSEFVTNVAICCYGKHFSLEFFAGTPEETSNEIVFHVKDNKIENYINGEVCLF